MSSGASANPSVAQIIAALQEILAELQGGGTLTDAKIAQLTNLLAMLVNDLQAVQGGVDSLMHGS